jgi:hypothetical protein
VKKSNKNLTKTKIQNTLHAVEGSKLTASNILVKKGGIMKTVFSGITTYLFTLIFLCSFTFPNLSTEKKGKNAEQPILEFKYIDYPASKFNLQIDSFTLGAYLIEFIQVTNKSDDNEPLCRSWFRLKQFGKVANQVYFDNIKPNITCAGIYIPEIQPRKDFFIASKFGDNDGKLIVINRLGEIKLLKGGQFYLTNDKRLIFTNHASEENGLTVFDLNTEKVLFEGKVSKPLADWYYQDSRFFATVSNDIIVNNKINLMYFDITTNKPVLQQVTSGYVRKDKAIKLFNSIAEVNDCKCKPEDIKLSINH